LGIKEALWDVTVFAKGRERFIDGEAARWFFDEVVTGQKAPSETGAACS
jgi:hypothetical protein